MNVMDVSWFSGVGYNLSGFMGAFFVLMASFGFVVAWVEATVGLVNSWYLQVDIEEAKEGLVWDNNTEEAEQAFFIVEMSWAEEVEQESVIEDMVRRANVIRTKVFDHEAALLAWEESAPKMGWLLSRNMEATMQM